jgi:hypothetical protein
VAPHFLILAFFRQKVRKMDEATLKPKLLAALEIILPETQDDVDDLEIRFDDTVADWNDYEKSDWEKFFRVRAVADEKNVLKYALKMYNAFPRDQGKHQ